MTRTETTATSGLIVVDKPPDWTSHDVVARVRRLVGTRRVGHAGTLDPMATGVLVVGVEKATRLLGHLALTEKEYLATIRLGQATDTGDAEGTILTGAVSAGAVPSASAVSAGAVSAGAVSAGTVPCAAAVPLADIQAAVATLTGPIQQVPPAVSAIKVAGKRSYQLAREGAAPELPARPVTVWSFEVLATRPATPPDGLLDVDVAVRCSSGTYIRALARDLGEALSVGGHLTMLRRTRVGPYDLGMARTLDELAAEPSILPIAQAAAAAFPAWQLTQPQAADLSHGRRLPGPDLPAAGPVAAFAPDGTFVALVEAKNGEARPLAVFVP